MVYGLPRLLRTLAMTVPPRRHCEALKKPWQSQYGDHHTKPTIVIARVAFATRGNLSMGYNYSFMEFFFFLVFVFVISDCGLLRRFTPSNDEEQ